MSPTVGQGGHTAAKELHHVAASALMARSRRVHRRQARGHRRTTPAHFRVRAGPPDHWVNWAIPAYLEAVAAWLEVCEPAYIKSERQVPADGWTIFAQAL